MLGKERFLRHMKCFDRNFRSDGYRRDVTHERSRRHFDRILLRLRADDRRLNEMLGIQRSRRTWDLIRNRLVRSRRRHGPHFGRRLDIGQDIQHVRGHYRVSLEMLGIQQLRTGMRRYDVHEDIAGSGQRLGFRGRDRDCLIFPQLRDHYLMSDEVLGVQRVRTTRKRNRNELFRNARRRHRIHVLNDGGFHGSIFQLRHEGRRNSEMLGIRFV